MFKSLRAILVKRKRKKMKIKSYDVIIDEQQASCGLVVDPTEYDISFFKNENLQYKIDTEKKTIDVFSDKIKVSFCKIDKKLIYYAFKTETLIIFIGNRDGSRHFIGAYEACLY